MLQLYFVRHGESDANVLQTFSNRQLPHGLTGVGRAQVEDLAQRLAGVPFARFYCSPILRAQQSAEILSARLGIDYVTTSALAEYDVGELEGKSDAESWRRYFVLRDAWFRDRDYAARIEGGESFDDIRARFVPLIEEIRESPPSGPVLLLGHGGTFHCMLPLIVLNITFDLVVEHGMGHTSVAIVEERPEGLVCVQWKDQIPGPS
jgi:broad specificity phosphatase PhoE